MPDWDGLLRAVGEARPLGELRAHPLVLAERLACLLALGPVDSALLQIAVACDRLPRVTALARIAVEHGHDLPALLGVLAGAEPHDAARLVRQSDVLRLGLASFRANRRGEVEVEIGWTLDRLLDRAPTQNGDMIDLLAGARQPGHLTLDDFAHVEDRGFLVRLLKGAVAHRTPGINILIHGPPGTGKTELARTLAEAAAIAMHGVGEADSDGDEPNRWDRVQALQLAQRLLACRGRAALLFDEMEDVIGDARPEGDRMHNRQGSKVFINRLLETNPVPIVWTTNAIGNIDTAILRRMSFVLHLGLPSRAVARRIVGRIAAEEAVTIHQRVEQLLDVAPETSTIFRMAARAGRLGEAADGGMRVAEALVKAVRGGELPVAGPGPVDLDFYETDFPLAPLFERIASQSATAVSLLLTGPPGTGKTALAHQLARDLDRPLMVKRASDLLSKWVGETEQQIAAAFAEARRAGAVLLFDEADSLLFDRTTASKSWEVGQVNEMLTWLDSHPLPVVAATNHADKLDPATLRRFTFKVALHPLGARRTAQAFERFFGMAAPAGLAELTNLTPGDFAVVARQLRHLPANNASELVDRLRAEADCKADNGVRMGF